MAHHTICMSYEGMAIVADEDTGPYRVHEVSETGEVVADTVATFTCLATAQNYAKTESHLRSLLADARDELNDDAQAYLDAMCDRINAIADNVPDEPTDDSVPDEPTV